MLICKVELFVPHHRGDHLAVLSTNNAKALGISYGTSTSDFSFVRLHNPGTGQDAFARLHVSDSASDGTIQLEDYIARNCSVKHGEPVEVELFTPDLQACAARTIIVREVDTRLMGCLVGTKDVLQRLQDSRIPLQPGQQFVSNVDSRELHFEVTNTDPIGMPVICDQTTRLSVEGAEGGVHQTSESDSIFAEIGGLQDVIHRLNDLVVLPLRHPEIFQQLGARTPKGILLHGPAGSGKTLLARAIAQSFGASFFLVNGPEMFSKWYGETEGWLRNVFAAALNAAPSVVFIDELDSIAPARDYVTGALEVRVVSQLLTMMDGLKDRGQIVVIGATNRLHAIEPALRRPGRFDCEIEILPPNISERQQILQVHTRLMPLASDVSLIDLARRTTGFVGADLAALCQEAALSVVRRVFHSRPVDEATRPEGELVVRRKDFEEALRSVQPSAFRVLDLPDVQRGWDELIGLETAKQLLIELVEWPLSYKERLQEFGIRTGESILIVGPSLSGKTSLVTALTRKLGINLVYIRADDLLGRWSDETERALKKAFRRARHAEPAVLLLDNFEQLLSSDRESNDLPLRVLRQIQYELAQLHGNAFVVTVVATRSEGGDGLLIGDSPYFSHRIHIHPPNTQQVREAVSYKIGAYLESDVDIDSLARELCERRLSVGQILSTCEDFARIALHEDITSPRITKRHVDAGLHNLYVNSPATRAAEVIS